MLKVKVAPRMGAWIETVMKLKEMFADSMSRPAWARGLKPQLVQNVAEIVCRAPHGRVD